MTRTLAVLVAILALLSTNARAQDTRDTVPITPDMSGPLKAALQIYNGATPLPKDQKPVGGSETKPGADPWQVGLVFSTVKTRIVAFCGGSLIAERWVLTAAHCIGAMDKGLYQVIAGTVDLDKAGLTRVGIVEAYVFKTYRVSIIGPDEVQIDDIALLKLASATDGTPIARAVDGDDKALKPQQEMLVTGWGATDPRPRSAALTPGVRLLNGVGIQYVPPSDCSDKVSYGKAILPTMLCAGNRQGKKDACNGDSGGPLTSLVGGEPHLFGIVSWGRGCAQPEKYGVYTRVAAYDDWIKTCLADGPCPHKDIKFAALGPKAVETIVAAPSRSVASEISLSGGTTPTRPADRLTP